MAGLIDKALQMATEAHKGQFRRYTKLPYIVHPIAVAKIIVKWGISDNEMVAAAFAHDMIEDTEVSEDAILSELGSGVLSLVKELSMEEGANKAEWLKVMAQTATARAVLVKVADRICNTTDYIKEGQAEYALGYMHQADDLVQRLNSESGKLGSKVVSNAIKEWHHLENMLANKLKNASEKVAYEVFLQEMGMDNKVADNDDKMIARELLKVAKSLLASDSGILTVNHGGITGKINYSTQPTLSHGGLVVLFQTDAVNTHSSVHIIAKHTDWYLSFKAVIDENNKWIIDTDKPNTARVISPATEATTALGKKMMEGVLEAWQEFWVKQGR